MSLGREFAKRFKRAKMRCGRCKKSIALSGRSDRSGKRHAHCRSCKLEWHVTPTGNYYAHPMKGV